MNIKLENNAIFPRKAHPTDVGLDLYSLPCDWEAMVEMGTGLFVFDTGVRVQPDPNYYVEVYPNSRLIKTRLYMPNSVGIIDPSYRGTIKVCYRLNGKMDVDTLNYIRSVSEQEQCVAQMIVRKMHDVFIDEVEELDETSRGEGGFGSTAKVDSPPCVAVGNEEIKSNSPRVQYLRSKGIPL